MSSSYKTINVSASPDGYVVTVELNRPEALNAMNTAMGEDLLRCFEGFAWDKAGQFTDEAAWKKYVNEFAQGLQSPIEVSVSIK